MVWLHADSHLTASSEIRLMHLAGAAATTGGTQIPATTGADEGFLQNTCFFEHRSQQSRREV
jgi:hypothetical protein